MTPRGADQEGARPGPGRGGWTGGKESETWPRCRGERSQRRRESGARSHFKERSGICLGCGGPAGKSGAGRRRDGWSLGGGEAWTAPQGGPGRGRGWARPRACGCCVVLAFRRAQRTGESARRGRWASGPQRGWQGPSTLPPIRGPGTVPYCALSARTQRPRAASCSVAPLTVLYHVAETGVQKPAHPPHTPGWGYKMMQMLRKVVRQLLTRFNRTHHLTWQFHP